MKTAVLLASLVTLASCATITRGTTEAFVVYTVPAGAYVRLSTGQECNSTPCTFARIPREAEFTVEIRKEGYRTVTANVSHQTSGQGGAGMAGNVLVGGIIGLAVDANSGATQDLVPNPLTVHLEALPAAAAADAAPTEAPPVVPPSTVSEPAPTTEAPAPTPV
ncbi:MAG: PEGA domain-containing protein [Caulobacteraceae bacterium]|nr:PEGA domain-containing protein [Caulobacteraceae bacterium]